MAKKVKVQRCVYCGTIKSLRECLDGKPCKGCGRQYFFLEWIELDEKEYRKILREQKKRLNQKSKENSAS